MLLVILIVTVLLQVGADVNIPNNHGLTPLEVINRYTDPRSGHHLKQLLQGSHLSVYVIL